MSHRALPGAGAALLALALILVAPGVANAASLGSRSLGSGAHGHDVRVLQSWLTMVGHPTDVDGRYGPGTTRSVRGYERHAGLRVDGRMSRGASARLRRTITRKLASAPGPSSTDRKVSAVTGAATLAADGRTAVAPDGAPDAVRGAIAAANAITHMPYRYGGGHRDFEDSGYDCSGAVSYALHGAGLLDAPLPSGPFMRWGEAGRGDWITVYARGSHAYVVIAGLRFDTSGRGEDGPRWRPAARSSAGFSARHPAGL